MSEALITHLTRLFQADLDAKNDAAMQRMAAEWLKVEARLRADIELLAAELAAQPGQPVKLDPITEMVVRMKDAGYAPDYIQQLLATQGIFKIPDIPQPQAKQLKAWQLAKLQRYVRLLAQVQQEIERFTGQTAAPIIDQLLAGSALAGLEHALTLINATLTSSGGNAVDFTFDRLGSEAVQNIVAIAGAGQPLGDLLTAAYPLAAGGITDKLIYGTAVGWNPRKTARAMLSEGLAQGLNHILLVARDQQVRSVREAGRQQYLKTGVVQQYRRLAAKQSRTCFLPGTLVATEAGNVTIEKIKSGDLVWTGKNRLRCVQAAMRRDYSGDIVILESKWVKLKITPNHPVLIERQGQLDWIRADQVRIGDRVISRFQSSFEDDNHVVGDFPIKRRVWQAHDKISLTDETERFSPVGIRTFMPVDAINFQGDIEVGQVEINRIPIYTSFLNEVYIQNCENSSDNSLWFGFPGVSSVTNRAAKFLIRHGRYDSELLTTVQAGQDNRWPAAHFRTKMAPCSTSKFLAASFANMNALWFDFMAAISTAAQCLGTSNIFLKGLAAICAKFFNSPIMDKAIAGLTAIAAGPGRVSHKFFSARFTCVLRLLLLKLSLACGTATKFSLSRFAIVAKVTSVARKLFTANRAHQFYLGSHKTYTPQDEYIYDTICSVNKQQYKGQVFNLEVDSDHTYYANGVVVHNCLACLALDGTIYPTEELMALHAQDRCAMIPIITGFDPIPTESGEAWFNRQSAEVQRRMMGPGRYAAWKAGKFKFNQLATIKPNDTWGPSAQVTSLKDLLESKGGLTPATPAKPPPALPGGEKPPAQRLAAPAARKLIEAMHQDEQLTRYRTQIEGLEGQARAAFDAGDIKGATSYFDKSTDIFKQLREAEEAVKTRIRENVLYVQNPANIQVNFASRFSKELKARYRAGLDAFAQMVGLRTLDGQTIGVKSGRRGRAYYDRREMVLPKSTGEKIVIHEAGHWLEDLDPEVHLKALEFYDRRTQGERLEWLGPGYGRHEVTRRDRFLREYMGKEYKSRSGNRYATEIISMGMEMMWDDPVGFARDDPDYFDFIFELLRG